MSDHGIGTDRVVGLLKTSVNDHRTHSLDFSAAVERAADAEAADNAHAAREAVGQALDALDKLEGGRERGEWSSSAWTADERGLWKAHLAARHSEHHSNAAPVGAESRAGPTPVIKWHEEAAAEIATQTGRESRKQAREYAARLAGQPVMLGLRQVEQLIAPLRP